MDMGQPCLGAGNPKEGLGGPWGGEDSNEESGIPSASPPPPPRAQQKQSPGECRAWRRASAGTRGQGLDACNCISFCARFILSVPGQHSGHSPMGLG